MSLLAHYTGGFFVSESAMNTTSKGASFWTIFSTKDVLKDSGSSCLPPMLFDHNHFPPPSQLADNGQILSGGDGVSKDPVFSVSQPGPSNQP